MKGYFELPLGKVFIDPTIVTRLCILPELALSDVFVLPNGPVPSLPLDQVNRKGVDRYVHVEFDPEGRVLVEVRLLVRYGPSIRSSATLLQENLLRRVETATGLRVTKIDIKIDGIFRPVEPTALPAPDPGKPLQLEDRRELGG